MRTEPPLLKAVDIARMLNVHPTSVRNWARAGTIPVRRFGKQYRFHPDDINKWLKKGDRTG